MWVLPYTGIVYLHLLAVNLRKSVKPNLHIPGEFHPMEEIKEMLVTAWEGKDIRGSGSQRKGRFSLGCTLCNA